MELFELIPSRMVTFSDEDTHRLEPPSSLECPICLDDNSHSLFIRLKDCTHFFCLDCFKEHLLTKIQARKVLKITCPQDNCSHVLPAKLLEKILDASEFDKYKEIVVQKANARVSLHSFCPKPGCSKPYIKAENTPHTTCSCGTLICNKCGRESHEGKDCIDALDGSFEAFIQENNLKLCIMCKTVVEKMEGCTHITCPVCDYEWCWLCGNEHTENHGLKCTGKWNPMPPVKVIRDAEPDGWRKTTKNILRIILFVLLIPVKLVFWPFFSMNIYGELRNPNRTTEDKIGIFVIFMIIVEVHGGIVGMFIWFAVTLGAKSPGLIAIIAGALLCLFILQVLIVNRYSRRSGRWQSRNSNIFRFNKSTQVHVGDRAQRAEEAVIDLQQAPQEQEDQVGKEVEDLKTAATPLENRDLSKNFENVAQNFVIEIQD